MENSKPTVNSEIVIVGMEDWEAIYVDGKLVDQDHSFDVYDVLRILHGIGILKTRPQYKYLSDNKMVYNHFNNIGELPKTLQEIKDVENNVKGDFSI